MFIDKTLFIAGFCKKASEDEKKPSFYQKYKHLLPAAAGAGTYLYMRGRKGMGKAPAEFSKMRRAAEQHGFTRVHLHEGKSPGFLKKMWTEMKMPADRHVHLSTNKSYEAGAKTKSVVFDPDETGRFSSKHNLGKHTSTSRKMDRSKIQEYEIARKNNLKLPKTEQLKNINKLKPGEIAKPAQGSQAKYPITHKDVKNYEPKHPDLIQFKQVKSHLNNLLRKGKIESDAPNSILNRHPGYKHWLVEQAKKNPHKFVTQPKIDIDKEFRVHTLHGQPLGVTSHRHALQFGGKEEAERAAKKLLSQAKPEVKNQMMALDVAKDKKGKWHIIETNPGGQSGFLTPNSIASADPRGPHQLYKAVTGRHSKTYSAAAGLAATGGVAAAQQAAIRNEKQAGEKMEHFWNAFEKRAGAMMAMGRASVAIPRAIRGAGAAVGRGVSNLAKAPGQLKNNLVGSYQAGQAAAQGKSIAQYHNLKAQQAGIPMKQYTKQNAGKIEAGQKALQEQRMAAKQKADQVAMRQKQMAAKPQASPPMGPPQQQNMTGPAQAPAKKTVGSGFSGKHLMIAGGLGLAGGHMMSGGSDASQQGYAYNQ